MKPHVLCDQTTAAGHGLVGLMVGSSKKKKSRTTLSYVVSGNMMEQSRAGQLVGYLKQETGCYTHRQKPTLTAASNLEPSITPQNHVL